jgi:arylamine N-acetyltransferase
VQNFEQLREYQKLNCFNRINTDEETKKQLNKIKGYIVLYPKRFLCFENLTPPMGSKEKLLPTNLWI